VRNVAATVGLLTLLSVAFPSNTNGEVGTEAVSILEKRCLQCHSGQLVMSGLRLTSRESLISGGARGPAIEPGNAARSLLISAVSHAGKLTMPPDGRIPEREIEVLRAWIDEGAPWPERAVKRNDSEWWAFRKPEQPPLPQQDGADGAIDAFLLARIRAAGIDPAAEADRLTLLKRATFDLLGLPPSAEQFETFLTDT
jgi:hypothetical protein